MSSGRTCTWCGAKNVKKACKSCVESWDALPDAATMSHDERQAELIDIVTNKMTLEIDYRKWRARVELLMQRPVWTHEFAQPTKLVDELRSHKSATFDDVIAKVSPEKLITIGR